VVHRLRRDGCTGWDWKASWASTGWEKRLEIKPHIPGLAGLRVRYRYGQSSTNITCVGLMRRSKKELVLDGKLLSDSRLPPAR